jgi:hypothetical protein
MMAGLTPEAAEAVRAVARYVASISIFHTLVQLDQFPGCDCRVLCKPLAPSAGGQEFQFAPVADDLHDDLVEWILQFSRHADQIAYREVTGPGSSIIGFRT